jgi:hypothetical protein
LKLFLKLFVVLFIIPIIKDLTQELFTQKGDLRSLRLGFQKYFYGINSMSYDNQKSYSKRLTASRSQTSNFQ